MIVGRAARNHPQQVALAGAIAEVDDRATDPGVFAGIAARFGGFTVDVAASAENAKCERFFDVFADGLAQPWSGERVWCNPPFSSIRAWIEKAWDEALVAELIVLLAPSNRTDQAWWHDLVEPFRDRPCSPLRVEFIRGRPRFRQAGETEQAPGRPPFGCCLLTWSIERPVIDRGLFASGGVAGAEPLHSSEGAL